MSDRTTPAGADEVCAKLIAWATAAGATTAAGRGPDAVGRSDLLKRLLHGGEWGHSETPCPVHKGRRSGMTGPWPGRAVVRIETDGTVSTRVATFDECDVTVQEWWSAGCRCATHRGSNCTTGWQPDIACGCLD